jgi:hypothetical protein
LWCFFCGYCGAALLLLLLLFGSRVLLIAKASKPGALSAEDEQVKLFDEAKNVIGVQGFYMKRCLVSIRFAFSSTSLGFDAFFENPLTFFFFFFSFFLSFLY